MKGPRGKSIDPLPHPGAQGRDTPEGRSRARFEFELPPGRCERPEPVAPWRENASSQTAEAPRFSSLKASDKNAVFDLIQLSGDFSWVGPRRSNLAAATRRLSNSGRAILEG